MFRKQILDGIDFLAYVQNPDGGIPGINKTGASACWTTSEALESILLSPYQKPRYHSMIFKMIRFILSSQITNDKSSLGYGAWPEYPSHMRAQTMTTGHTIAALKLACEVIFDDDDLHKRVKDSIERGFVFLNKTQNRDGGWGLEPEDTENGKLSKAFNTVFVLRGYVVNGYTYESTRAVKRAVDFLKTHRNADGGFARVPGEASDVCYTARIISILINSKAYKPDDKYIKTALRFIFNDRSLKELFRIKNEAYVSESSAGLVVFHSNTPIDVMEALCKTMCYDKRVRIIEKWIVENQEDCGGWELSGEGNRGIITWPTNEAIFALICAENSFQFARLPNVERKLKLWRRISISALIALIIMFMLPINIPTTKFFESVWISIPNNVRVFITVTLFTGLGINILSNIFYDMLKNHKARKKELSE